MAGYIAVRRAAETRRASSTSLAARVASALAIWRQRRNLAELPAYLREDLGLTQSQVLRESRRPIWDAPELWRS
ncbi:DUF1127 domain-containing protein [Roseibacterium sp. SDUM158016]|uniref:DUF1127 domain-containing protein n=1 Tax=Roseicyclus sediminis TaxID=2980997 RepID=UPI0021D0E548|nr:DUF1127 domain-containing protein [Roseibacterium sp. SDUM158016]MCU4652599.1 DUF1127 domain-containing protein [Roseibacterium sp. SDUM158016]